jgi:hypothetical protein
VRNPEERRARGGWRGRRKNDIKMGLVEINWKAVNWINGSGCLQ